RPGSRRRRRSPSGRSSGNAELARWASRLASCHGHSTPWRADGNTVHTYDLAGEGRPGGRVHPALARVDRVEPPARAPRPRPPPARRRESLALRQLRPVGDDLRRPHLARRAGLPRAGRPPTGARRRVRAADARGSRRELSVGVELWDGILAGEELAYLDGEPAREARAARFPEELHPKVRAALDAQGVDSLYEHQAEAWDAAAHGEHVAVVTGTASGKSLAFNL